MSIPKHADWVKEKEEKEAADRAELEANCKKIAGDVITKAKDSGLAETTIVVGGEDWKDGSWNAKMILRHIKDAGWPVTMEYTRGAWCDASVAEYTFDFSSPPASQK